MNFDPAPWGPEEMQPNSESAAGVPEQLSDNSESLTVHLTDENSPILSTPPLTFPPVVCRRCGKTVAGDLTKCPYCEARLPGASAELSAGSAISTLPAIASQPQSESSIAVTRLLIFYLLLLCTNLVGSWIAEAMSYEHLSKQKQVDVSVTLTVLMEVLDIVIVLIALAKTPRPPPVGPASPVQRKIGWLAGLVILAVAMALNFGYHALLRNYVQFPLWARSDLRFPIGWAIVLICMQPGIVEELFFRYLALGTLTRVMGVGAAICVSSLMFGMAHSGVLLSIPILTVVGMGLGLVRVWSGSILLPMLLHMLHNAVVVYLEVVK